MSTKADFYVGRDTEAEWMGSIAWDGTPVAIPKVIREATSEEEFREQVARFLKNRSDAATATQGWPWTWDSSYGTNYTYAFAEGKVWTCHYGSSWWDAMRPEPEHTSLKRKGAILPDMSNHRKRTAGPKGQGILIVK